MNPLIKKILRPLAGLLIRLMDWADEEDRFRDEVVACDPYGRSEEELRRILEKCQNPK